MVFKRSIVLMILVFFNSSCTSISDHPSPEYVWNQTWDAYDRSSLKEELDSSVLEAEIAEMKRQEVIKFLEQLLEEIYRIEIRSRQNQA